MTVEVLRLPASDRSERAATRLRVVKRVTDRFRHRIDAKKTFDVHRFWHFPG
jgi:hypothetical protein